MDNRYIDLISQTFEFPQEEFKVDSHGLLFNDLPLVSLVETYGTPLRITYLPKIGSQINKAKMLFGEAIQKLGYKGNYTYVYCTKSSHFSFVIEEALKHGVQLECSSAYDIAIVNKLFEKGKIGKDLYIICNGYKRDLYKEMITGLVNNGFTNTVPVLDNINELNYYNEHIKGQCSLGIRIAAEEEPNFEFYTSRLGIRYTDIVPFYNKQIKDNGKFRLKMLNFHINTGIRDSAYYWNEMSKCLNVYCELKQVCPELDTLNIGGGLPIKNSLGFEYDYAYVISELVNQVHLKCTENGIEEPNIMSEFGTFTVGESGAMIYSVLEQKLQNDRELWYMIDSSFITTLPDTWAINQRYILLAVNGWENEYRKVNLGGLTCDSMDYYNSEAHHNEVFLPKIANGEKLYIGFFNTGAYQETLGGYGGIKHCLIPGPRHIVIDRDEQGQIQTRIFKEEQAPEEMLGILGY